MTGEIGMDPRHIKQIYDLLTGLAGERARGLYRLERYLRMIEERNTVGEDSFDIAAWFDEMRRTAAAYDRYPEILMAYAGRYEEMTARACSVISEIEIVPEE
jgi:hypothetical protein